LAIPASPPAPSSSRPSRLQLFGLALAEGHDPEPFYTQLAAATVAVFPFPVAGRRVLDLGSGSGELSRALETIGAVGIPVDLGWDNCRHSHHAGMAISQADGRSLPFADGTFDGVVCSNLLEHTPTPERILDETCRVLRPGGWAWISWTNWYSPWGGHGISPFHYLGPRLGTRAYVRLFGPPERNLPFDSLWPTSIGRTLRDVGQRGFRVLDVVPRYYPSQRWVTRVPGLRELATWNCLLLLERVEVR
jgi:SAM-dependent methyltransferase